MSRRREGGVGLPIDRGTNRNLCEAVASGAFSDDLCVRLNLWTFLYRDWLIAAKISSQISNMNLIASPSVGATARASTRRRRSAIWGLRPGRMPFCQAIFINLAASLTRMATLRPKGRIDLECVEAEMTRPRRLWSGVVAVLPVFVDLYPRIAIDITNQFVDVVARGADAGIR